MTPPKTAADYAAIAVAPMLIFLMISSLANFLMLILYHGGFPERVSWTLLMFTLGAVGIARVAIERDRAYALGYAGILGFLAFVAMLRFVDSPLFSAFILVVIAYLADVIVRDCTLIDDTVDASGQGLIDSGRLFLEKQIQPEAPSGDDEASDEGPTPDRRPERNTHQPGRTVMYLALAALPLFGLGQFFLRSDPGTWARAQLLLALYLFSGLSLLVTTSFLGLRRYLRQRRVEMPGDVSIAWLAGGLALIAAVLLVAYIAPLPGKALASFELPKFLDSPGDTEASQAGWGGEGADKSNPDAPTTTSDPHADEKEIESMTQQEGAPAGDVGDGNRDQGPTGKQDGGDQQSGGKSDKSSQEKSPQQQDSGGESQQSQQQQSGDPSSKKGEQQSDQGSSQQQSGQQQSNEQQSSQQQSDQQGENEAEGQQEPSADSESQDSQNSAADQNEPSPAESERQQQQQDQQRQQNQQQQNSGGLPPEGSQSSPPSSSPGMMESVADAVPMVASFIKFLIFAVLAGIVGAFLWMNRHAIAQWWNRFFGTGDASDEAIDEFEESVSQVPRRAFASFRNPIGKESDLCRIVVITFQAFEAWTREHGTPRGKDETPAEFIRRVAQSVPQVSAPASQVVDAYNRIVYGRGKATKTDLDAAEKVWHVMQSQLSPTIPPVDVSPDALRSTERSATIDRV